MTPSSDRYELGQRETALILIKKNKTFLIYKEIHKGAVAKSHKINGLLIYD